MLQALRDVGQTFLDGLPLFAEEGWHATARFVRALYLGSLVLAGVISMYGFCAMLYRVLYGHLPYAQPVWPLELAALYTLIGVSIAVIRHVLALGRAARNGTGRPLPGAGIEMRRL